MAIDHPVQTTSCWEVMKYGNFKVTELYESKAEWWHGGNMYNKFDHSKRAYTQKHVSVWLQNITSSRGCGNLDFEIWADEQTERKSQSVLDYHLPQHLSITASHKVAASSAYVNEWKVRDKCFFFSPHFDLIHVPEWYGGPWSFAYCSNSSWVTKPNGRKLASYCASQEHRGTYFRRLVMRSHWDRANFVALPW